MTASQVLRPQDNNVLPLENGDSLSEILCERLSRDEFERRYDAMNGSTKAERIEGVVYIATASKYQNYGRPQALIVGWLGLYEAATPGVEAADNATVRLDLDNDPQPDALLRIDETCGGQSRIDDDDYVEGAPELIVEIAASTASYDLHDKKRAYRRNGVKEYIVWAVADQQVYWFSLQNGQYIELESEDGIIKSCIFPGLNLNIHALLKKDLATVLATLQSGLGRERHQQFVQTLAQ